MKDTVVGGAKGVANLVIDTANTVNLVFDLVSPIKAGQMERFKPSTPGEQGAMIGVAISATLGGGISSYRSAGAAIESSRMAAMTQEMGAAPGCTHTAQLGAARSHYP